MSSNNAQSAVTYTFISSDSDEPSWGILLMNAGEFSEMDPYEEVAQQGKVHPLSPTYVPNLMELDEHMPVHIPEPEHPEYHAPSDNILYKVAFEANKLQQQSKQQRLRAPSVYVDSVDLCSYYICRDNQWVVTSAMFWDRVVLGECDRGRTFLAVSEHRPSFGCGQDFRGSQRRFSLFASSARMKLWVCVNKSSIVVGGFAIKYLKKRPGAVR
nr:hypothetical protein [Tanacetum cinerariifolium]